MSTITLPEQFQELLAEHPGTNGKIHVAIAEFSPWFQDNRMVFFPGYTDHGIQHLNEVLQTSASLISDAAWDVLTKNDAAAIILATILHDCAMHLSEEGFLKLTTDGEWFDPLWESDLPWVVLWQTFLHEASRFDERKLIQIFGDSEPCSPPPLKAVRMTSRDHLLIGEFIRRHHPRLAQEIALYGVPGPTKRRLALPVFEGRLNDTAGLIARSHGMSIRRAIETLPREQRRERGGVHVAYIMSVLRIADYIQIQSGRAPKGLLRVRSLKSPLSVAEWKKHEAIQDIVNTHDDPEALFVTAEPKDVSTFLSLRTLFKSIQSELDQSWAVLGEHYGRVKNLEQLGLTIRRIRSNLDIPAEFVKHSRVGYVPELIRFEASEAELLQLLIGPLYGDSASIGIRELIQNAVDACMERKAWEESRKTGSLTALGVRVYFEPSPDFQHAVLVITDTGIGMTLDILRDFFLKAGASFRRSIEWKKEFIAESGHYRVNRAGRFGVGALATFLLGDDIEVTTRHISAVDGIGFTFSCRIDTHTIEVSQVECEVGTTIRVKITNPAVLKDLDYPQNWDWFCYSEPEVARTSADGQSLKQSFCIDRPGAESRPGWYSIPAPGFQAVNWSYATRNRGFLFCNGIKIGLRADRLPDYYFQFSICNTSPSIFLSAPTLEVCDPTGRLPLTLTRDRLGNSKLPFHDALVASVAEDFVRYLNESLPAEFPRSSAQTREFVSARYPGHAGHHSRGQYPYCGFTIDGWVPLDVPTIRAAGVQIVIIDFGFQLVNCIDSGQIPSGVLYIPSVITSKSKEHWARVLRHMMGSPVRSSRGIGPREWPASIGPFDFQIFWSNKLLSRIREFDKMPTFVWNKVQRTEEYPDYSSLESNTQISVPSFFSDAVENLQHKSEIRASVLHLKGEVCDSDKEVVEESALSVAMRRRWANCIVPLRKEQR